MPQNIDRGRVAEMLDAGVPVIDVLHPKQHDEFRIAGSIGLWIRELDAESVSRFSKTDPIVVYCHDHL